MRPARLATALPLLLLVPTAAAQGAQDYTYSWLILAGLLTVLVLFGVILQLRKPRPKKTKEQTPETTDQVH